MKSHAIEVANRMAFNQLAFFRKAEKYAEEQGQEKPARSHALGVSNRMAFEQLAFFRRAEEHAKRQT